MRCEGRLALQKSGSCRETSSLCNPGERLVKGFVGFFKRLTIISLIFWIFHQFSEYSNLLIVARFYFSTSKFSACVRPLLIDFFISHVFLIRFTYSAIPGSSDRILSTWLVLIQKYENVLPLVKEDMQIFKHLPWCKRQLVTKNLTINNVLCFWAFSSVFQRSRSYRACQTPVWQSRSRFPYSNFNLCLPFFLRGWTARRSRIQARSEIYARRHENPRALLARSFT